MLKNPNLLIYYSTNLFKTDCKTVRKTDYMNLYNTVMLLSSLKCLNKITIAASKLLLLLLTS